jgi:fimbrial isopeptide formation D2 family protein/LPXTG-motif cell wall-anchored protein
MKTMKKMMVLVLSIMMVLGTTVVTSFAADPTGKVTVDNAVNGEEYTLYKVFDAKVKEGRQDQGEGISYSSTWLTTSNDWFAVDTKGNITITDAGKDTTDPTKLSAGAIAWLKTQTSNFTKIGDAKTAANNKVEWENLADGYYYVSTTTGSFITVDSITPNVTVKEKNTIPTGDKKQSDKDGDYANALLELNIGDTVYYQYEITNGKGSDKDIVLADTMTTGLTFDQNSITVTKDGNPVATDNYEVTGKSATGFTLTLKADYVKTLAESDKVVVKYTAKINANAVVDNATGNSNTATLTYSHQTSTDVVYVATYDFLLKKTDGTNYLPGAGFKLYDALTGGNLIAVAKDNTGYYKDAADVEIVVDSANGVNVRGLKPGKYYLEETTVPNGFNPLTTRQEVIVTAGQTSAPEVVVVNHAGTELPSTGGMGTTILYIVGGLLVVGCGIMLVAKKKADK